MSGADGLNPVTSATSPWVRRLCLAPLLGFALLAEQAPAAPTTVSGAAPTANVKVLKPLVLTVLRNLDFGQIAVGQLTAPESVSVTTAGRSCGTANLSCSGTFTTARFLVNGSNNQQVFISSATPTFTLVGSNGGTLTFTPTYPSTVTLDNSGNPGAEFDVGGSITITPTTPEGTYSGTIDIQVAYQ